MKKVLSLTALVFLIKIGISQQPCFNYGFPMNIKLEKYNGRIHELNTNRDTLILGNSTVIIEVKNCSKNIVINEYDKNKRKLLHSEYIINHDTIEKIKVLKDPSEFESEPFYINSKYFLLKRIGDWLYFDTIGNVIKKIEYK